MLERNQNLLKKLNKIIIIMVLIKNIKIKFKTFVFFKF